MTELDPARDDELAQQSRRGDPRALAVLYCRHAPALLGYLEHTLGERADAEDVLHESFLRLFEGRGRYRSRGRFREWLFTVATRIARDRVRTAQRRDRLANAAADELAPARGDLPDERAAAGELAERVESVLHDLPEPYAAVFHLRVRERFSYREIAAITGEPEGTLRSRVHHALKRVRHALTKRESNPRPSRRSPDR